MSLWWLVPIAVVIVVAWTGLFIGAFLKDRQRGQEVERDSERLDVDPHGPTSTPRERHDPSEDGH